MFRCLCTAAYTLNRLAKMWAEGANIFVCQCYEVISYSMHYLCIRWNTICVKEAFLYSLWYVLDVHGLYYHVWCSAFAMDYLIFIVLYTWLKRHFHSECIEFWIQSLRVWLDILILSYWKLNKNPVSINWLAVGAIYCTTYKTCFVFIRTIRRFRLSNHLKRRANYISKFEHSNVCPYTCLIL